MVHCNLKGASGEKELVSLPWYVLGWKHGDGFYNKPPQWFVDQPPNSERVHFRVGPVRISARRRPTFVALISGFRSAPPGTARMALRRWSRDGLDGLTPQRLPFCPKQKPPKTCPGFGKSIWADLDTLVRV